MKLVEFMGVFQLDHYWILPNGAIETVQDHHSSANAIFGNDEFPDNEDDDHSSAMRSAMAQGWIRVNCGGEIHAQFVSTWTPGRPSDAAFRGLRRLIGKLPEAETYYLNGQAHRGRRAALQFLV
jgi:hypothetical protein